MRSLLAAGAKVNQREYEGETPLMYAAAAGQSEMILFLLEQGADINAVSNNGETALVRAGGDLSTVEVLLEKGADVELGAPLIRASDSGQLDTVKVLLKHGANPNAELPGGGTALIAAAVQSGSKDIVEALIAAGADVSHKNKQGKTAEMLALENNHADLAEMLRRASIIRSR
jgi:ankyrin repeat protein